MPDGQPDKQPGSQPGIQFGSYLPQVALGFEQMLDRALECERLGYDALWMYDHLYAPAMPAQPSLRIAELADAGFSSFIFFTHDRASTQTLELFATEVMPRFKGGEA
jgi:alkanesulfonate monooxygenase SsuD/methylene tetrahydromethanopterin reductase-like flavin-dependent oxidoreductase (luciferase family)